jgi:hypothetical protein
VAARSRPHVAYLLPTRCRVVNTTIRPTELRVGGPGALWFASDLSQITPTVRARRFPGALLKHGAQMAQEVPRPGWMVRSSRWNPRFARETAKPPEPDRLRGGEDCAVDHSKR